MYSQIEVVVEEITDAEESAKAKSRRESFDRNSAWLHANASEVYTKYRGKFICIAGEELFVGNTFAETITKAKSAHPEDDGKFVHYIPKEKVARIYANQW
jgi:hypothetical protein